MKPIQSILLVEDNPDDVFFMKRALKAAGIDNVLHVAGDGREAINYLAGEGAYADRVQYPLPCLTLLDLKLPHRSGHEVLEWVRDQEKLRQLVIVVLTTSKERRDIDQAYHLGANAYLVKPSSPPELVQTMVALKNFWLNCNLYPDTPAGEPGC